MYIIHHIETYAQHECNNKRTTGGGFVTSRWKSSKLIRREGCYVTTGQMTRQLSMVKMVVMMMTRLQHEMVMMVMMVMVMVMVVMMMVRPGYNTRW